MILFFLLFVFISFVVGLNVEISKATGRTIFLVCLFAWIIVEYLSPDGIIKICSTVVLSGSTLGWRCSLPFAKIQ